MFNADKTGEAAFAQSIWTALTEPSTTWSTSRPPGGGVSLTVRASRSLRASHASTAPMTLRGVSQRAESGLGNPTAMIDDGSFLVHCRPRMPRSPPWASTRQRSWRSMRQVILRRHDAGSIAAPDSSADAAPHARWRGRRCGSSESTSSGGSQAAK